MILFDTHTHLYLPEFDADRDDVMQRAIQTGVKHMLFPNVDCTTIAPMRDLHERYPECTSMAMGLHPTEIGENWREEIATIERELSDGETYVAIGEIGIDLYWDKTYIKEQMEAFDMQVGWAVDRNLPIIIHCREGLEAVLEVLGNYNGNIQGVFHSFGGSAEDVERVRRYGDFHFGINGIVTFKNSRLREVIPDIGVDRIILETDAPYLAPVPYRGKRNETAYVLETAKAVAAALQIDPEELASKTTVNAEKLFLKME